MTTATLENINLMSTSLAKEIKRYLQAYFLDLIDEILLKHTCCKKKKKHMIFYTDYICCRKKILNKAL